MFHKEQARVQLLLYETFIWFRTCSLKILTERLSATLLQNRVQGGFLCPASVFSIRSASDLQMYQRTPQLRKENVNSGSLSES